MFNLSEVGFAVVLLEGKVFFCCCLINLLRSVRLINLLRSVTNNPPMKEPKSICCSVRKFICCVLKKVKGECGFCSGRGPLNAKWCEMSTLKLKREALSSFKQIGAYGVEGDSTTLSENSLISANIITRLRTHVASSILEDGSWSDQGFVWSYDPKREEKKFEKKMEYNLGRKRKRVEKVTAWHWGSYCIISRRTEGIMMIKMVKKLSIVILFVGDRHADSCAD